MEKDRILKIALLVIDVQMGFAHRDASGVARSCPEANDNIAQLLAAFRNKRHLVIHIHHHSCDPNSVFRAGTSGAKVQPFAKPLISEKAIIKHVNSAFIGTTLEMDLNRARVTRLVLCGGTANHCVETTARMAGNLGFDTVYVSDAVWAYGATGPDGCAHSPEQVHAMSLCNLDGEFATVLPTAKVLDMLV